MRIAYNNLIDSLSAGSIVASTALTAYPVTNIQDQRLTTKWATDSSTSNSVIFTFDTFPEYPDDPAGTTYKSPVGWPTTDSWAAGDAEVTVDVSTFPGFLYAINTTANKYIYKTMSAAAGFLVVIRAFALSGVSAMRLINEAGTVVVTSMLQIAQPDGSIVYVGVLTEAAATHLRIYFSLGSVGSIKIAGIYVGTGVYLSQIKDQSENNFNFSANSIILTSGLINHKAISFANMISYLKSVDTINYMPNVLTTYFSFPSGWAQTVTARTIYSYATVGSGFISEYKSASSDSLILSYFDGTTTATAILPSVFTGYSSTRLDLCVIKNFSSSVSYLDSVNTISANSIYAYVNGSFHSSTAFTALVAPTAGKYFYIGAFEGASAFSNAVIGEIRAYNRGLALNEIKNIYNGVKFNTENLGLMFKIDPDYEYAINTAGILGHNIKSGTKVQLLGNNSANWNSPALSYTFNYVASSQTLLTFLSSASIYKYWKFQFGSQGDLSIGRIWLGSYENIDPSSTLDFTVTKKRSDVVIYGKDRQKWSNPGIGWRRFELSFPKSDYSMIKKIEDMYDYVGIHKSFIFCNFDTIRDYQIVEPCYVSFSEDMQFQHTDHMKFTYKLIMEEDK